MKFKCEFCGKITKEDIKITDAKYFISADLERNVCSDCFKLWKNFDDKALEKKIIEKMIKLGEKKE